MLQTLIERAGFKELLESVQQPDGASAKDPLAKLPQEIQHFDLESFHDRPVQAELMELLLLEKDGTGFTTNVLIHGMGGTGKTVTAVAVVQEKAIRRFFSNVSSKAPTDRLCLSNVFSCTTHLYSPPCSSTLDLLAGHRPRRYWHPDSEAAEHAFEAGGGEEYEEQRRGRN